MKKVIVIGCPGSGKSTFSRLLHKITGLPLYHLDRMFWNADKTTVEKSVFLDRLSETVEKSQWILDGNYASTMEFRMRHCDTVIFLDYPTDVCLEGIRQRRGKPRSDMPWTENGEEDADFVAFVHNFYSESRPQVMELLKQYSNRDIHVFSDRSQAEEFLEKLQLRQADLVIL